MTTWGTMWNEVLSNLGRPASDATKAKRSIVDAIDQHRGQGFFFNEAAFSFATVDGQTTYGESTAGFPKGLIEIIGGLSLEVGQDAANVVQLERVSWPRMQQLRAATGNSEAQPECWSFWNRSIELWPTPDATVHDILGWAVSDVGTIIMRFDTDFRFYIPNTTSFVLGNEVADAYPVPPVANAWFAEGYRMIRCYAEYLFYAQTGHAQDSRPQALLQRYLEAKSALEQRSTRMQMPRFVEPMGLFG